MHASSPSAFAVVANAGTSLWVLGQELEIRVRGEDTGGAHAVTEATASPGWPGAPAHIHHREDETVYVTAGQLLFTVDGERLAADAGTLVHIPRGSLHTFENAAEVPSRLLTTYTPAGFEKWFEEIGEPILGSAAKPGIPDRSLLVERGAVHGLEIRDDQLRGHGRQGDARPWPDRGRRGAGTRLGPRPASPRA